MNKCPHCDCSEKECLPWQLYCNIENYGSNVFNTKCCNCGKMVFVGGSRRVEITTIQKSSKPEQAADFGG